jgi:hypothetical protein
MTRILPVIFLPSPQMAAVSLWGASGAGVPGALNFRALRSGEPRGKPVEDFVRSGWLKTVTPPPASSLVHENRHALTSSHNRARWRAAITPPVT